MNGPPATAEANRGLNRPDIQEILEALAVRVHEAWVHQRQAEGWTWGRVHNGDRRQHPGLVAYGQLPESEKEASRRTARISIQGLLDSGFEILPPKRKQIGDAQQFAPILQRLGSTAALSLAELRDLWGQCKTSPFRCPAEIHLRLGERMVKQGEAILAYDALSEGLGALEPDAGTKEGDGSLRLRMNQLLALALAQSGAAQRAQSILLRLCEHGGATPETLGLLGRVFKDLARTEASPVGRHQYLEQSFQSYLAGFEKADAAARIQGKDTDARDASYCGINAAAVQVLRHRIAEARMLAQRVKQICLDRSASDRGGADYWLAATLAEAELIGGRYAEAEGAYRTAARLVQGNWRELCSTRRQARLLAAPLGLAADAVDRFFPPISIAVFAAPALAKLAPEPAMRAWEQRQKDELKRRLAETGVVCGYASAMSPADLLFIEIMLETDREINVLLPCPRPVCRRIFEAAPAWAARFDRLLSRVPLVTEDTQPGSLDGSVNRAFARQRALGAGLLRAQRLDAALQVWASEDAGALAAQPEASSSPSTFEKLSCPYETIPEEPWLNAAGPARSANGTVRGKDYAIRAMLFGDVKGYSKLSDEELLRFAREFMQRAAEVLDGHAARILSRRTAGDGLFLVFADLEVASAVALQLRDMVAGTRWDECGLPANLGIRISLDAGPVYAFEDPVTRRDEVCGTYVNRAARIEPITPPNEVYASEAFAALAVATGCRAFRFDYVGQTELPKGFGLTPLYCVNPEGA
jgi:class 3 adenylate cyclase